MHRAKLHNNCKKLMPRLVTAFALAVYARASGMASKARAKAVTAHAERYVYARASWQLREKADCCGVPRLVKEG